MQAKQCLCSYGRCCLMALLQNALNHIGCCITNKLDSCSSSAEQLAAV